jgi:hypothetical protein
MKRDLKIVVCIIALFCFYSCSQKKAGTADEHQQASLLETVTGSAPSSLPVNDYMHWVENKNNGLLIEKNIGEITFSALYKPYPYLATMELRNDSINEKKIKEKIKEYEGLQYFTFKIAANDQQRELLKVNMRSEGDYYSRLEYFSFEMQHDFKLIEGKDTLDCALYHFERVYGLAPYATMVLGFPLTKAGEQKQYQNKTISYTDKIFGAGKVNMTFKGENLNRLPELVVNEPHYKN